MIAFINLQRKYSLTSGNKLLLLRKAVVVAIACCGVMLTDAVFCPSQAIAADAPPPPSAPELMRSVVAQLPREPLTIAGKLIVRRRRGVPVAGYHFELNADWGAIPPSATYRIDDNFGDPLEQLTIFHGSQLNYKYMRGNPLENANLTGLSHSIQKTDLTWADLTLAFLWWPDAKITGEESIRTFDCYIVEVSAPEGNQEYKTVKIWISRKNRIMLQAEGYDKDHKLLRKLWIKSCKKIDGKWMIKDMEIQKYPALQRTKLRVLTVEQATPSKEITGRSQAATIQSKP